MAEVERVSSQRALIVAAFVPVVAVLGEGVALFVLRVLGRRRAYGPGVALIVTAAMFAVIYWVFFIGSGGWAG